MKKQISTDELYFFLSCSTMKTILPYSTFITFVKNMCVAETFTHLYQNKRYIEQKLRHDISNIFQL